MAFTSVISALAHSAAADGDLSPEKRVSKLSLREGPGFLDLETAFGRVIVEKKDMEVLAMPSKRGRPKKGYDPQQFLEVMRLYFVEKLSMREVADLLGVSHMSIYRMLSDPNVELLI